MHCDGLLAVSWCADKGEKANRVFDLAIAALQRFKQIQQSSDFRTSSTRIASFRCGEVSDHRSETLTQTSAVAAGWVFPRDEVAAGKSTWLERLYDEQGADYVDQLDGQFCAVVASPRTETLYASGDCGGLYPWYTYCANDLSWVSTSAMALASSLGLPLDYAAVKSLLSGSPVRSPSSLFQNVRRMPYGERAVLSNGELQLVDYWRPFQVTARYTSLGEAAEAGIPLVKRTSRQVLSHFKAPVCDLTSGLDTRLLVAAMAANEIPFSTTVGGAEDHIDVRGALDIARQMDWPIVTIHPPSDWGRRRFRYFQEAVRSMDGEISAHLCDAPQWCKHQLRQKFDVSATGGGGELFREFPWEHLVFTGGRTSKINIDTYISLRLPTRKNPHSELFDRDWTTEHHDAKRRRIQEIVELCPEALNTQKLDAVYLWRSSGHFGRYSGGLSTVVPSPVPLMGRDALEFCLGMPARFRKGGALIREMISQTSPRLAEMPTCWGGSAKPMGIRYPLRSLPYWNATLKRWTRKIGQKTIGWSIFADPFDVKPPKSWDNDFVNELRERSLLDCDTWTTAALYTSDGLASFLSSVGEVGFRSHPLLYTMLSIEMACRDCQTEVREPI